MGLVGGISSGARRIPDLDGAPFRVSRSLGPHVWDDGGRQYIDLAMGFGATMLGHAPAGVLDAVRAALANGPMPAFPHRLEEQAAEALARHVLPLSEVIFVNSGSEAVHLACRAARALTGRRLIAKVAAGYDGWYDGVALGTAMSTEARLDGVRPTRDGVTLIRWNDLADAERLFADHADIAAIIVEPVLANAGCLMPQEGYLAALGAMARAHGALVIADEVLMGFRLSAGLTAPGVGLTPDLATVGKAIGSGFAVAALVGTPAAMEPFTSGRLARQGTYNGNAVASAAVLATMDGLDGVDYPALLARGERLRARMCAVLSGAGVQATASGYGSVFSLWRGETPPLSYDEALARYDGGLALDLHLALRRHGVVSMAVPFGRYFLTAAHDAAVCSQIEAAFADAVQACGIR